MAHRHWVCSPTRDARPTPPSGAWRRSYDTVRMLKRNKYPRAFPNVALNAHNSRASDAARISVLIQRLAITAVVAEVSSGKGQTSRRAARRASYTALHL